jgi:hypothetical protein
VTTVTFEIDSKGGPLQITVDPDPVSITSTDTIEWEVVNKTGLTLASVVIDNFTDTGTGKPADPFGGGSTYTFTDVTSGAVTQTTGTPVAGPTGTVTYKYDVTVTGSFGAPTVLDPRVIIAY